MEPESGFGRELSDGTKVFTNCTVGGPIFVYVKNGRIIRVTPIEFGSDDAESWIIEAHGRVFSPPRKTLLAPYVFAARSRVYSTQRVLYPLIREDFNPKGERHPENRGKSKYVRISWEEALSIIVEEIERLKGEYGASSITATTSSHYEWRAHRTSHLYGGNVVKWDIYQKAPL